MEQVEINILRPLPHLNRFVRGKDDIAAENIMAVVEPDMRMKRVVYQNVVLASTVEAFAQLQPPVETEIVVDVKVGGAVVQIDIPAVIAAPARVRQNIRIGGIQQGKFCVRPF